jgi:hypothetical protein
MKIRSTTFRGPIYNSLSIGNLRQIAMDSLTTKNLHLIASPKKTETTEAKASAPSDPKQSSKPNEK